MNIISNSLLYIPKAFPHIFKIKKRISHLLSDSKDIHTLSTMSTPYSHLIRNVYTLIIKRKTKNIVRHQSWWISSPSTPYTNPLEYTTPSHPSTRYTYTSYYSPSPTSSLSLSFPPPCPPPLPSPHPLRHISPSKIHQHPSGHTNPHFTPFRPLVYTSTPWHTRVHPWPLGSNLLNTFRSVSDLMNVISFLISIIIINAVNITQLIRIISSYHHHHHYC